MRKATTISRASADTSNDAVCGIRACAVLAGSLSSISRGRDINRRRRWLLLERN